MAIHDVPQPRCVSFRLHWQPIFFRNRARDCRMRASSRSFQVVGHVRAKVERIPAGFGRIRATFGILGQIGAMFPMSGLIWSSSGPLWPNSDQFWSIPGQCWSKLAAFGPNLTDVGPSSVAAGLNETNTRPNPLPNHVLLRLQHIVCGFKPLVRCILEGRFHQHMHRTSKLYIVQGNSASGLRATCPEPCSSLRHALPTFTFHPTSVKLLPLPST